MLYYIQKRYNDLNQNAIQATNLSIEKARRELTTTERYYIDRGCEILISTEDTLMIEDKEQDKRYTYSIREHK